MKKLLFALFTLLLAWSCSPTQKAVSSGSHPPQIVDSTEYEAIIIDPEFDHWYLLNYSDAKDYSNEYYRGKNHVAVTNWNDFFIRNRYPHIIDESIVYDYSIDYGIEVNRKLYWYFKYVEERFKIKLLH